MNYLDKQIDNDLEREEHEQRRADCLRGVHKGGGQVNAVKVLVRRGELLAQLDGVGKVEAAESADEHIADEPGDVLELLRQALHKNVKAEVLLMTDDDGEIEHQHPDEQVAAELLAPPDGRVEHVSGDNGDEGDAGKAYDKRAADVLEDLLKDIKDFTNCFQVYYLHLRLFVYVQSDFDI